jgi:hypothetical protein
MSKSSNPIRPQSDRAATLHHTQRTAHSMAHAYCTQEVRRGCFPMSHNCPTQRPGARRSRPCCNRHRLYTRAKVHCCLADTLGADSVQAHALLHDRQLSQESLSCKKACKGKIRGSNENDIPNARVAGAQCTDHCSTHTHLLKPQCSQTLCCLQVWCISHILPACQETFHTRAAHDSLHCSAQLLPTTYTQLDNDCRAQKQCICPAVRGPLQAIARSDIQSHAAVSARYICAPA